MGNKLIKQSNNRLEVIREALERLDKQRNELIKLYTNAEVEQDLVEGDRLQKKIAEIDYYYHLAELMIESFEAKLNQED